MDAITEKTYHLYTCFTQNDDLEMQSAQSIKEYMLTHAFYLINNDCGDILMQEEDYVLGYIDCIDWKKIAEEYNLQISKYDQD